MNNLYRGPILRDLPWAPQPLLAGLDIIHSIDVMSGFRNFSKGVMGRNETFGGDVKIVRMSMHV